MPLMATLAEKIQCEQDTRAMLERNRVPQPDRVEYGHTCIRLFWEKSKVVLIVDIDDPADALAALGEERDDLDLDDPDLDDLDLDDLDLDEDGEWSDDDDDYDEAAEALERLNGRSAAEEADMN